MLTQRLLTAAIGIPLLLLVLWAGHPWLGVLLAVAVLLAAVEVGELFGRAGYPAATGVVALLAVLAVVAAAAAVFAGAWLFAAWLVVLVVASASASLTRADADAALRTWLGTAAGALIAAMPAFLLLIALAVRPDAVGGPVAGWLDGGRWWLLIVVLGVWSYDSAAYLTGRAYGRGRFFNAISPRKTMSGAIGGSLAAVVACGLLGALVGRPVVGIGLGAVIALAAPAGDLTESMLKRVAGVKDSGRLFPGHGGMLDRLDAFIVVAPAAWLYLVVAGLA